VLRSIARGLAALHAAGVVHRDLKPANVLLDARGAAKVSDFGIARFSEDALPIDPTAPTAAGRGALTGTGRWLGTLLYMAPESGLGAREVTPASDVFAFGLLACEILSGALPFASPPALLALTQQPLSSPAPLTVSGLDSAVSDVLRACLAEDPAARPSLAAVLAALG
jgi:serine/threonine-protein kinase